MGKNFRRFMYSTCAVTSLMVAAYFLHQHLEYVKMHTIPAGLQAFEVNGPIPLCGRWKDTMPKMRAEGPYRLYIAARKLWRSKVEWEFTRQELLGILHDVQAASNQGDWGARALMAYFYREGLGPLESNKVLEPDGDKSVEIVRMAVAAGQAWGYYDLGVAHEYGYGGAVQDHQVAWAYFLKAAELGSPEAQMALADAYLRAKRHDAEEQVLVCAYRQGHALAAHELGVTADIKKNFKDAIEYYQAGVWFGNEGSAVSLRLLFAPREWGLRDKGDNELLGEINVLPDAEREARYHLISQALQLNPDLRLTRLDKVLPLPPAKLPPWNGVQDAIEPESDGPPTY